MLLDFNFNLQNFSIPLSLLTHLHAVLYWLVALVANHRLQLLSQSPCRCCPNFSSWRLAFNQAVTYYLRGTKTNRELLSSIQFSSTQDVYEIIPDLWYLKKEKKEDGESPYVLHPISQKVSPQRCLWKSSNVSLIDNGPVSFFQC